MKKHYVPGHKWKRGKNKRHPGYWRKTRPKSKKTIVEKKPTRLHAIRDKKTGYILGYK